jgi:hypothetical protein
MLEPRLLSPFGLYGLHIFHQTIRNE